MRALLNPPLADVRLWLLHTYDAGKGGEGLHLCSGHWARFGATLPKLDRVVALGRLHYRDS
jgi:hypothetical protein